MTADSLSNDEEVAFFLRGMKLTVGEPVVREVVLTILELTGHTLYDLYARSNRRDGSERTGICGKGTAYKIKRHLEAGELDPYLAFLCSRGVLPIGDETRQVIDLERVDGQAIQTCFNDLDELMDGMYPGDLVILAGKPSTGKSIMAQNIMLNAARYGHTAGFFGLETRREQVSFNILGSEAGVDPRRLKQGLYSELEGQRIRGVDDSFPDSPFLDISTDNPSIGGLRNSVQAMSLEHNLDLLVLDYIQLLDDFPTDETASAGVSLVAKGLKSLARDLAIPILALYQIEQENGWRPPDIQDSVVMGRIPIPSSLAGYADQVLVLQVATLYYSEDEWEEMFPEKPYPRNIVTASLVKNRRGPTGTVKLRLRSELARFESLARAPLDSSA